MRSITFECALNSWSLSLCVYLYSSSLSFVKIILQFLHFLLLFIYLFLLLIYFSLILYLLPLLCNTSQLPATLRSFHLLFLSFGHVVFHFVKMGMRFHFRFFFRIERSRSVVPAFLKAAQSCDKFLSLNFMYFYQLLFTKTNLKLVHVVCHDKSAHNVSCDTRFIYKRLRIGKSCNENTVLQ